MKRRVTPSIALQPSNFFERVESMAEEEGQPIMHDGHPIFEWTPSQEITDEEEQQDNEIGNNLINNTA